MEELKKNILDLEFQKQLIVTSTTIVICFTYFVGLLFAVFSSQINFDNLTIKFAVLLVSISILGVSIIILSNSYSKIKNIPEEIKMLR